MVKFASNVILTRLVFEVCAFCDPKKFEHHPERDELNDVVATKSHRPAATMITAIVCIPFD